MSELDIEILILREEIKLLRQYCSIAELLKVDEIINRKGVDELNK